MCGRYAVVSKIEEIQKAFRAEIGKGVVFKPQANIGAGKKGSLLPKKTNLKFGIQHSDLHLHGPISRSMF